MEVSRNPFFFFHFPGHFYIIVSTLYFSPVIQVIQIFIGHFPSRNGSHMWNWEFQQPIYFVQNWGPVILICIFFFFLLEQCLCFLQFKLQS